MDSIKKSYKGNNVSFKHTRRISAGGGGTEFHHEELPILHDHEPTDHHRRPHRDRHSVNDCEPSDRTEVILKIDDGGSSAASRSIDSAGNGGKVWRESRYDFWNNDGNGAGIGENASRASGARASDISARNEGFEFVQHGNCGKEDPPTKLIGEFLNKQKIRGDTTLDMDLEMEELRHDRIITPMPESPLSQTSKDLKVSFQQDSPEITSSESVRRRYRDSRDLQEEYKGGQSPWQQPHHERRGSSAINGVQNESAAEAARCTSNLSFQSEISFHNKSHLLRAKTKSRLMDPPSEPDLLSGLIPKSGQLRSGFLSKMDDDDDDPFQEEDLPDDFKRGNFNALTLLQWVSLVLITGALVCTLSIPYLREKSLWELDIWKWEVMVFILICGRLVSGWGIRIVVFFIERNFLLRKRVLYFVYGVRKPVQNCLWLGLVLIAWHLLFDKRVESETNSTILNTVRKVLVCLLMTTLIWLVKTLMVKVLASSFHVSTYFDRIQESLFNQYVIETLSGPPLVEIRKYEEEEERIAEEVQKLQNAGINIPPDLKAATFDSVKSGRTMGGSGRTHKSFRAKSSKLSRALTKNGNDGITIDHLHKLSPKNVSAWNMKRLLNIVRYGSISTLDEQIPGPCLDDESTTEIKSEREAKAGAKKIFQNVARRGFKYIYLDDLMRFMREDEVFKTMSLFEGAIESRRISKSSLKNWVVNAFRERRALALTLNDTKTAVDKLHHMVNVIFGILILILWLIVLGIASSKFFLFLSSQVVVVAFIFGNTCKTIFEAIIFLFVMHPFDVGDRCEIDGMQMVVEEMNILTTVFLRYDNLKTIIPNSVLATKLIHNFYRSPDMCDTVEFCVHIATPAEKIAAMKQKIEGFVEGHKEHWYPSILFLHKDVEGLTMLKLSVWLSHRINHQDSGERWVRRSTFVEEVVKICQELDIQFRLLPLDINVRALPSSAPIGFPSNWTSSAS